MSGYDKNYDAFEIFEEIVSQPPAAEERRWKSEKIGHPSEEAAEKEARKAGAIAAKEAAKYAKQVAQQAAREAVRAAREMERSAREQVSAAQSAGMYYEIEYDSSPIPGAGKFVLKSQKVEEPARDEIRERFDQMRNIARENRSLLHNSSKFYDRRVQQEKANIFYKQGMFMKDFEDDYETVAPYSSYFPYYQLMGYDQLRTYFTWRTKVRKGSVTETSLSYAYLYMYELLDNIGVESPENGLEKLLFFWKEFRAYNNSIDRYVLKWLKDYHIYYELPESFQEFVSRNQLEEYYPNLTEMEEKFDLYCAVSKYDIRKSVFYTEENRQRIRECFQFTFDRLTEVFAEAGMPMEEAVFQPTKNMALWQPFKDALFHPWMRQRDRRVVLSEKEIYICSQNRWTFNSTLTTESGTQLVGYVMKQMEAALRGAVHFKYKLTASPQNVNPVLIARLKNIGVTLEGVINAAVAEYYREATKTVVRVDMDSLAKIRREALQTQEKLIVEEDEVLSVAEKSAPVSQPSYFAAQGATVAPTPWDALRAALTAVELEALELILEDGGNLKQFADAQGVMLEVLMDGISEKAMDSVGDSLFDEEFVLYEDYIEDVRRMVER